MINHRVRRVIEFAAATISHCIATSLRFARNLNGREVRELKDKVEETVEERLEDTV